MEFSVMLGQLAEGMVKSIGIFALTLLFSLPLGLLVSFGRMAKNRVISTVFKIYISIMRGTPLMLQLLVVFYGPFYLFGANIGGMYRFIAIILGFSLNYAAYFAEIFRGGFQSIDEGQFEAAKVLRLSRWQTMTKIIIPQVIKIVLPSIGNEVINLVKDSSLVYVIGLGDLLRAGNVAMARDVTLVPLVLVGVIYLLLIGICAFVLKKLENHFSYYK